MKRLALIAFAAFAVLGTVSAADLNVAAAANIVPAVEELKASFERANPGVKVKVIGGSSGKLSTQIRNGAPFDVFLSADREFAEDLERAGFTTGEVKTYARGSLILFTKKLDLSKGLAVLKEAAAVAIAKPELAPYGKAAFEALERTKLLKDLEGKIVFAENVSQAAQFALTAADAGFFNKSSLFTPAFAAYADKEGRNWIEIPAALYTPIDQGAVVLKYGAGKKEAASFFQFLRSEEARALFRRYGYLVN